MKFSKLFHTIDFCFPEEFIDKYYHKLFDKNHNINKNIYRKFFININKRLLYDIYRELPQS